MALAYAGGVNLTDNLDNGALAKHNAPYNDWCKMWVQLKVFKVIIPVETIHELPRR